MVHADKVWKIWYTTAERILVEEAESLFSVNEMLKSYSHYATSQWLSVNVNLPIAWESGRWNSGPRLLGWEILLEQFSATENVQCLNYWVGIHIMSIKTMFFSLDLNFHIASWKWMQEINEVCFIHGSEADQVREMFWAGLIKHKTLWHSCSVKSAQHTE